MVPFVPFVPIDPRVRIERAESHDVVADRAAKEVVELLLLSLVVNGEVEVSELLFDLVPFFFLSLSLGSKPRSLSFCALDGSWMLIRLVCDLPLFSSGVPLPVPPLSPSPKPDPESNAGGPPAFASPDPILLLPLMIGEGAVPGRFLLLNGLSDLSPHLLPLVEANSTEVSEAASP